MHEEIIIAGFGGQGILLIGRILCIAAMKEGKYVSDIPSYGAEMRGGTASASVIISDKPISSPTIEHATIVMTLNEPSLNKFESYLKEDGLLIYNSSLIKNKPLRQDIKIDALPASEIAEEFNSGRSTNMAFLGRLLHFKPHLAQLSSVINALDEAISERNRQYNDINQKIIEKSLALRN